MNKLFFLFLLLTIGKSIAQQDPCATTTSYSLTYQSTNGSGSCTFLFTPTVTINQMGSSVKLVQYTFTIESTTVQVCYSGNPLAIVNCNGSFSALPEGANQVFPTATVILPCTGNGTIVLRGSTSTQGTSTCTTQTIKSGPLPVKLVSFNGSSTPAGVVLNWATEWESLNEGYEIQKSATAQSFENIGFVQGQGSTHKVSGYEFIDANVEPGTIYYYRLKQKDVGGIIEYSPIISVLYRTDQEMPIKVYPNGNTGGRFMLSMSDAQSATIRLFTEAGIEVPINVSKTTDPNQVSVAAKATLSSGVYFLKVNGISDPQQQVIRVIVQ